MIRTELVSVDLEGARMFLAQEKTPEPGVKGTNRKASAKVINEYAAAMLRGEWLLTPHGIAISEEGVMVDGGHRMRALIQAATEGVNTAGVFLPPNPNLRVAMMVAFGVPADSVRVMDIGKRRLPHDFLTMDGEVNVMATSAVIRPAYCYENVPWSGPQSWLDFRITPTMQAAYLEANPSIREAVAVGSAHKRVLKPSASGAFWVLAQKVQPLKVVEEFLEPLRTGANLEPGNPVLTLRELMFTSREIRRVYTVPEELALTIKAFNRWVEEGKYELLMFRWDEKFPRIKGEGSVA
jgi:hypothetical protein